MTKKWHTRPHRTQLAVTCPSDNLDLLIRTPLLWYWLSYLCTCQALSGIRYFSWLYSLKEHHPLQCHLPKGTCHDRQYKFVTLPHTLLYFSPYRVWLSNTQENLLMAVGEVEVVIADCFSSAQDLSVSKHFCNLLQHPPDFVTCLEHNKHSMHIDCLNQIDHFSSWGYIPYCSCPRLHVDQQKWRQSHGDYCHQVFRVM